MVLAIYRSFSFAYPLFASQKKMPGLSVTYSEYWHPLLPDVFPRNHKTNNSNVYPFIPQRSSHHKTPKFKSYQEERVKLSCLKKEREREAHSPSLRVANYGVQINSNGKPSTSLLHNLQIFHVPWALNLAKVPTPSWITLWLSNTGNQGMQTSSYP